jgi:trigger factor
MQELVKIEDISDIEKRICINVDPDTVNKKFDDFFLSIKGEAQIPGFRKGKVPTSLLKKYFKNRAQGTISQMLVSEHYQNAIREHNINPVGNPTYENGNTEYPGEFKGDNSYEVKLIVEVLPKINPVGYTDIDLSTSNLDTDSLFKLKMEEYQNQFAERQQIDGPAELGDSLVIDSSGFLDGVPIDGSDDKDHTIDSLGQGGYMKEFEEQIVGMMVGETKDLSVTFPENYNVGMLANKKVDFNVTVKNIVRKTPAAVDEDLALMAGFSSTDEFIKSVQDQVNQEANKSSEEVLQNRIIEKIIEENDFEVPKSLLMQEEYRILQANRIENLTQDLADQIKNAALKNVKRAILLEEIYEKENLEVSMDELNSYLEEQAKLYGKEKDEILSMLNNSNQMDSFMSVLRSKKTIEHIIKINTKKVESTNE